MLSRLAALADVGVLVGAIALVEAEAGLIAQEGVGYELDLALIAGLSVVALLGPERPSLDHLTGIERGPVVRGSAPPAHRAPAHAPTAGRRHAASARGRTSMG